MKQAQMPPVSPIPGTRGNPFGHVYDPAATLVQVTHDPEIDWNEEGILDACGRTVEGVQEVLLEARLPIPTPNVVYQWISRGRITHKWVPMLVYALVRAGRMKMSDLFVLKA